jgi:3-phosphoshikimate 1-carboxyvinyltransferase
VNAVIESAALRGRISAIPAKAAAHRALIAAALSGATVDIRIGSAELSQDISATIRCLDQLGAKIIDNGAGVFRVSPTPLPSRPVLDCGESGSTLRFLLPVAAALGVNAHLTGCGRLPERPLSDLVETLRVHGISFSDTRIPFDIRGKLAGGRFELPGNVSSQYVSGLLFALYAADLPGEIVLTTRLESSRYVDMTLMTLRRFGARIEQTTDTFTYRGRTGEVPATLAVEGDWSNAATFLVCGALGGEITVTGLDTESLQPDRAIVDILRKFGANVTVNGNEVTSAHGTPRTAVIDVSETPDLLPVLAVLAAGSPGKSRFVNAARLRLKESDRLHSTAELLKSVGVEVAELPAALEVTGGCPVRGGSVDSFNDHRLVMAAVAAAALGATPLTVVNAGAIRKSQPDFFAVCENLGMKIEQQ